MARNYGTWRRLFRPLRFLQRRGRRARDGRDSSGLKAAFEQLEDRRLLAAGISGSKWHDLNGDGLRDAGEPGLDDGTIELVDPADGSVVASTTTASIDLNDDGSIDPETEQGLYSFEGLDAGDYQVREVPSGDWVSTAPTFAGGLAFVEVVRDGDGPIDGLSWVADVVLSGDGLHLYAASTVRPLHRPY
jgi:hypothetical protein